MQYALVFCPARPALKGRKGLLAELVRKGPKVLRDHKALKDPKVLPEAMAAVAAAVVLAAALLLNRLAVYVQAQAGSVSSKAACKAGSQSINAIKKPRISAGLLLFNMGLVLNVVASVEARG